MPLVFRAFVWNAINSYQLIWPKSGKWVIHYLSWQQNKTIFKARGHIILVRIHKQLHMINVWEICLHFMCPTDQIFKSADIGIGHKNLIWVLAVLLSAQLETKKINCGLT